MRLVLVGWCSIVIAAQRPLLEVAADPAAPLHDRAVALHELGRTCTRDDIPLFTRLGQPYVGPWVIWHGALEAMSQCPLEQLAPYWRDLITFPRLPVRQIAIVGLLRTGKPGDIEMIHEAMHRETDPVMQHWAQRAEAILRLPIETRAAQLPK